MTTSATHPRGADRAGATPPPVAPAAVPDADDRPTDIGGPLRQLALRLHFYVGLLVGPFLLVAALSGFVYALAPTIERVVYDDQLTAATTAQNVPLPQQIATARTAHPDLPVSGIVPGDDGATTRVLFSDETLPSTSYSRVVFVDPSDGTVRGDTVQYGSGQALPLRTWLSETHRSLHLGDAGRLYSELAASWLAPLALAGLYLWWGRTRRTGSPMSRSEPGLSGRARARSRHAVVGTWALVGMLVLAATGLTWSTYAGQRVSDLRSTMGWTTPALSDHGPATANEQPGGAASGGSGAGGHEGHGAGHGSHAGPAAEPEPTSTEPLDGAAVALSTARAAGLTEPVRLTPPSGDAAPWQVQEVRRSWTPGPDAVSVDAASGAVVESLPFADYPVAAKLTDWGIRLHMGFLFGLANQLLLAAVAAVIVVVTLRGYALWWTRRPARSRGLARPPSRGAALALVRRRPLLALAGAGVVVAAGWAVPLLGISLAGFLVLDAILGLVARRTRA